ncbi:MAG TPA: SGNH hydrolase domain-containing protein [Acidimicrobiia bacterium]
MSKAVVIAVPQLRCELPMVQRKRWGALEAMLMTPGLRAAALATALGLVAVAGHARPALADETPRRVLIAGDSVGFSLFPALQRAGAARGVQVESAALFACPVVDGVPVDDEGKPFPTVPACPVNRPEHYRAAVARFRPDVVVWISSWETSARVVDGQLFRFGTIVGNRDLVRRIDEAVGWLTSTGARVVFVPLPPSAQPSDHGVPSPTNDARLVELTNVLRTYGRQHSAGVSVVDLPALICPHGPPCPADIEGVAPRPADGTHFEGSGATWVADRVLPLALAPPAPSPVPSGANAALTARA